MTFLKTVMLGIYLVIGFFSWLVFTCWLHDTKLELNKSWLEAMLIAVALAFVWPMSLVVLYFHEKGNPDK